MKKLMLSLDALAVESFSPGSHEQVSGTVKGREVFSQECYNYTQDDTCLISNCSCVMAPCNMASRERTFVCCQGTANCPPG